MPILLFSRPGIAAVHEIARGYKAQADLDARAQHRCTEMLNVKALLAGVLSGVPIAIAQSGRTHLYLFTRTVLTVLRILFTTVASKAWINLPLGAVKPSGWLHDQVSSFKLVYYWHLTMRTSILACSANKWPCRA
jgi:hypothetical protein